MIVVVIISILVTTMMANYFGILNKVKEKQLISDLNVLKKGIIQFKNQYGYWPENPAEVVNKGIVRWGNKRYYQNLINKFGHPYKTEEKITGNIISTLYEDSRGNTHEVSVAFTPPYKAAKAPETFFFAEFEKNDFKTDIPQNEIPSENNLIFYSSGAVDSGRGCEFRNGYSIYPVTLSDFNALTIEFWAKFKSDLPTGTIVHLAGQSPEDTREIRLYFETVSGAANLKIDITSYNVAQNFVDTQVSKFIYGKNLYSLTDGDTIYQPAAENTRWFHFAVVYEFDEENWTSSVNLYVNGKEEALTLISPSAYPLNYQYSPFKTKNDIVIWDHKVSIGYNLYHATGLPYLNNTILDNISISGMKKTETDFIP
jgi:type II secretory pathway pseudopilin PulG